MSIPSHLTSIPVVSSNIDSVAYDAGTSDLYVTFKTGKTYHCPNVKAEHYHGMLSAASAGAYFNKHIRPNREISPLG